MFVCSSPSSSSRSWPLRWRASATTAIRRVCGPSENRPLSESNDSLRSYQCNSWPNNAIDSSPENKVWSRNRSENRLWADAQSLNHSFRRFSRFWLFRHFTDLCDICFIFWFVLTFIIFINNYIKWLVMNQMWKLWKSVYNKAFRFQPIPINRINVRFQVPIYDWSDQPSDQMTMIHG